ncbi:LLM class flavin-dependent oxidoreductase [Pseudonocardia thermophila]|uniref:LLM class flavin-dependent oxidoreductase n=1 Tax=Pseudonocardia thermophila TaxID=1848 RepID=UPI00248ED0A8|nr:LLM class flavin-dependent oxidoreductase [Pseudonocardia thermophila]
MTAQEPRRMRLGMLIGGVGNHQGAWRRPESRVEEITSLSLFTDLAHWAEAAKIDALFMADGLTLETQRIKAGPYGHLEPVTLLSALAARTERIGFIGSVSTTFTEPYNLARQMASLDHISGGRAAWNIVTSAWGEVNFGVPLPSHADRYVRAAEFVEVVTALWDSWADDAVLADRAGGTYALPERVRRIDHVGEHFRVEGPLNVPRSPQGRPVLVQAGSSADGKNFAARYAEVVFTAQQTLADSQAFYRDLKARVAKAGRDPEKVKILPGVSPIVAPTEAEAQALATELRELINVEVGLERLQKQLGGVDLSGLDLDGTIPPELLPPIETVQGRQSRYGVFKELAVTEKYSIRRLIEMEVSSSGHWVPIGSPEQIADLLTERFTQRGCDGFVLLPAYIPEGVQLLTDAVIPILRERGLFREEYEGVTLRENLGLDRPAAR